MNAFARLRNWRITWGGYSFGPGRWGWTEPHGRHHKDPERAAEDEPSLIPKVDGTLTDVETIRAAWAAFCDRHLTLDEAWLAAGDETLFPPTTDSNGDRQGCDTEAPCRHAIGWTCTVHKTPRGRHHREANEGAW